MVAVSRTTEDDEDNLGVVLLLAWSNVRVGVNAECKSGECLRGAWEKSERLRRLLRKEIGVIQASPSVLSVWPAVASAVDETVCE